MAFLAGFPLFGGPALADARRPGNFRFRGEMTDIIDEEELKARYCFSKNSIEFIADLISEDIERDTKRNKALLPFTRVVGDTIGVDNSTVSRSGSVIIGVHSGGSWSRVCLYNPIRPVIMGYL